MTFTIISIIVISVIGTLSHFLYEISNHNKIVGIFTAVNESVWEHIKIALTPTILWSIIDGFVYGSNQNYFLAKFISLFLLIILIPILFYGYKKLLNKEILIIDILIFYIAIICSELSFYYLINTESVSYIINYLSLIGIFIIFGSYLLLTIFPIKHEVFKDPISKKYGYKGHTDE